MKSAYSDKLGLARLVIYLWAGVSAAAYLAYGLGHLAMGAATIWQRVLAMIWPASCG